MRPELYIAGLPMAGVNRRMFLVSGERWRHQQIQRPENASQEGREL